MDSAQLQIVIRAVDEASAGLDKISASLKEMGGVSDQVNTQLADGSKAAADSMDLVGAAATRNAETMTVLDARVSAGTEATLANTRAQQANTDALLASTGAADKHNTSFGKMGTGTIIAAAAVGYAIDKTVQSYANLQTQMTKLVTSAGESTSNLNMVTSGVQNIAKVTGTSLTDLGNAMYYIESGGFHGADGLKVMTAAAKGAKDEQASALSVADATTTILNAYGLSAGHASETVNGMITSVSRGKTTLQLFSDSLASVLPVAARLGISFAEVGGAIATMTSQGMTAQRATQDLNHLITALSNPTTIMTKEMLQLGLNSQDVALNLGKKGLTGTMEELSNAIFAHMGPGGAVLQSSLQNSMLATADLKKEVAALPGPLKGLATELMNGTISWKDYRKDIRALSPDMENLGAQLEGTYMQANSFNTQLKAGTPDTLAYTAALSKATGGQASMVTALMLSGTHAATFKDNVNAVSKSMNTATDKIIGWSNVQGTFNQQMSQLRESLVVFGQQIGKALIPMLTMMAKGLAIVFTPLSDLITKFPVLTAIILGVVGTFTVLLGVAVLTAKSISLVKSSFDTLGKTFDYVTKLAKGFAVQLGIIDAESTATSSGGLTKVSTGLKGIIPEAEAATASIGAEGGSAGLIGALGAIGPAGILAGVAVAGTTALIATHWGTVKKGVDDAVSSVKTFLGMKAPDTGTATSVSPQGAGMTSKGPTKGPVAGDTKSIISDNAKILDQTVELVNKQDILASANARLADTKADVNNQSKLMIADLLRFGQNSPQYMNDLLEMGNLSMNQAKAQRDVDKAQAEANKSGSALEKLEGSRAMTLHNLQKAIDAIPAANKKVISSEEQVKEAHANTEQKLKAYTTAITLFKAGSPQVIKAHEDLMHATQNEAKATQTHTDALNNQKTAIANAKKWTDDHAKAIKQLGLSHDQTSALIKIMNGDINSITNAHVAAKSAADKHKDSIDNLKNAHANAHKPITDLTGTFNDQYGKLANAKDAADKHKDAIHHLADAASSRKGDIDRFNDSLDKGNAKATTGLWGNLKSLFHFASGVTNFQGGLAVVGEQGPELVTLPQGSSVIPADKTQQIIANTQAANGTSAANTNVTSNSPLVGTLNVHFDGPVMGNQAQAQALAVQIFQSLQQVARQYGKADNMPQIGIRPI